MTTSVFPGELSRGLHEAGSDVRRSHLPTRSGPPLQRITLGERLIGMAEGKRAALIDVSLSGALIAHEFRADVGTRMRFQFDWRGESIIADCEVMRAQLHASPIKGAVALYRSGVAFRRFIGESEHVLRTMVSDLVTRALDERRANARGIPPLMARSFQTGRKGAGYLTLVFAKGVWQRFETIHPEQPQDGFTVSIDEDPAEIALLCEAWEIAASSHRQMIREVARISVSNEAGIPARRYDP